MWWRTPLFKRVAMAIATAIQKVRWTGTGNLKIEKHTVFYSGETKHERVGFIVSDQILQNVKRFEAISDRMCYLEIQCRWFQVILINCYEPTEDKDANIKSELYEDLERVYNTLITNNIKLVHTMKYLYYIHAMSDIEGHTNAKNGKAPREDVVVLELLKKGGQVIVQQLGNIIQKIWKEETLPK